MEASSVFDEPGWVAEALGRGQKWSFPVLKNKPDEQKIINSRRSDPRALLN